MSKFRTRRALDERTAILETSSFTTKGSARPSSDFAAESQPVRVLMLLDVSPSMSKYLADLGAKSTEALALVRAGDEVALMGFAARSQLDPAAYHRHRNSSARRSSAISISRLSEGKRWSMKHCLKPPITSASQPGKSRKSILIVTDNEGARRTVTDDAVVRALHAGNIIVSAILVGESARHVHARPV